MAGLVAIAVAALAAIVMAPAAQAEFSLAKCEGTNITGEGASFQKEAQELFNEHFGPDYCFGTGGEGLSVTYKPEGSGAGIKAAQLRERPARFGATDDPPTPAQVAIMNSGGKEEAGKVVADTDPNDDAKVHVVPIAVGAVAPLVNLPEGCNVELLKDEYRTVSKAEIEATPAKKGLLRIRMPKTVFEKVWGFEAGFQTWDTAFPELAADSDCQKPIIRVVRFDQSGTTFAFKSYLNAINPSRNWLTTYATGANETKEWPGAEYGSGGQCGGTAAPGKGADATDHLTSGCANGNGKLVPVLQATDGSIGYSDLATARSLGVLVNPAGVEAPTTPYWTQVQNGEGNFTEPTFSATGYQTAGARGSNCKSVTFTGIPSGEHATFEDWSKASGVNSPQGFGICTLTYALLFDDNAAAYGASGAEEAKARTAKDYFANVVGVGMQGQLFGRDYAALPESIRQIAQTGVNEIGWNKANEKGNEPEETPKGGEEKTTPTPPPPVAPPSNDITLGRTTVSSKTGSASLSVNLPAAGKLDVLGTARVGKKKIKVGHLVLTAAGPGNYKVTLKPNGAAKQALRKAGKLAVTLTLTFTPDGGAASTKTQSVMLKLAVKKGHG
ncbi:MAG TPA: substrate-binding domain-containing protein [Solirubrobacterales bacterium]|jgi:ABC-type phosphate transport system substrate-binding protein|nr:substrate-binding domain-containing protein [Solirubrobacterales bacterium]